MEGFDDQRNAMTLVRVEALTLAPQYNYVEKWGNVKKTVNYTEKAERLIEQKTRRRMSP